MKEITRIHLAKTPFDIEVDAKKMLERYLDAVAKSFDADDDAMREIEARMVEILAERGVTAGGVIGIQDVNALRDQMGTPADFGDEDTAGGDNEPNAQRRLYRDTSGAVLGGVLAGIAKYLSVNVWILRLIAITLVVMSFGTVLIVYLVLWLVVPPARTAADVLQLEGKPATAAAIHRLNDSGRQLANLARDKQILSSLSVLVGLILLVSAVSILACSTVAGSMLLARHGYMINTIYGLLGAIAVFGIAMLVGLLGLLAYGFLSRKWTKRLIISSIIVTMLGLAAACGLGAGGIWLQAEQDSVVSEYVKKSQIDTPSGFDKISSLSIDADNAMSINYHVVTGTTRFEATQLPDQVSIDSEVKGGSAVLKITLNETSNPGLYYSPNLDIYGPSLGSLTVKNATFAYVGGDHDLKKLAISARNSDVGLSALTIDQFDVSAEGSSAIDATSATVRNTNLDLRGASLVRLATVKSLSIASPDTCSEDAPEVDVEKIIGDFRHNNNLVKITNEYKTLCLDVLIGAQQ